MSEQKRRENPTMKEILGQQPEPENIEKELSPEIVERVMEKLRDINEKGIAYSGVARSGVEPTFGLQLPPEISSMENSEEAMRSVLEHGLLSISEEDKLPHNVYFNINGRCKNIYEQGVSDFPVIERDKPQVYYGRFSAGRINVMFDISFLKEADLDFYLHVNSPKNPRDHSVAAEGLKSGQYMVNPSPEDSSVVIDAIRNGQETESYAPGTGFVTTSDIEPKYFLGVVIPAIMRTATEQEREQYDTSYMIDDSKDAEVKKQEYVEMTKKIMLSVDEDRPDILVPIYDAEGNLLFPKKMSYEEVKDLLEKNKKE